MFISTGSAPFPPRIWAKWGTRAEDAQHSLFLHFGPDLTVMLTSSELLDLQLQIAAAMDIDPGSLDQAPKQPKAEQQQPAAAAPPSVQSMEMF